MKDKVSSAKLKGTVLFTVVSVLMVLIVFLMGTLALAATASNRAYTNYQTEQTEYTARAVLDSVVKAINDDTSNSGIKSQMVNNLQSTNSSINVNVSMDSENYAVTISNVGTQSIYSTDQGGWVDGDIYEVSTTVNKTLGGTTYNVYIVGEHITQATPSGGGGAFVSMGDLQGKEIGTGGYITGGTYIGVGIPAEDYTIGANGITTVDSPFYVNGNLTNVNKFNMHFSGPGDFFAITGDFIIQNNAGITTDFEGYTWGTETQYEKTPYIYVGKDLYINHATLAGSTQYPVNIYAGSINGGSSADVQSVDVNFLVYGDVYTFDANGTSRVGGSGGSTALYEWAERVLYKKNGSQAIYGNWYSMGNVEFTVQRGGNSIAGDLRVEKNVKVTGGNTLTVTGDVVCGGTLTVEAGTTLVCKNLYAANVVNNGTIKYTGSVFHANTITNNGTVVISANGGVKETWYELTDVQYVQNGMGWDNVTPLYTVTYTYNEHIVINGGAETVNTITAQNSYFMSNDIEAEKMNAINSEITTYNSASNVKSETIVNDTPVTPAAAVGSVDAVYGDIYPDQFTKAGLSTDIVKTPNMSDYTTGYPVTREELTSVYDAVNGKWTVQQYAKNADPANNVAALPKNNDDLNGGTTTEYYEVNNSCVISGTLDRNLYINPGSGNAITVVLDNTKFPEGQGAGYGGTSIIINDASQVTLFIIGTVEVNKGSIITTDYLDLFFGAGNWSPSKEVNSLSGMISDLTIHQVQTAASKYYPNVVIYSEANAALSLPSNDTLVTALIRAPKLTFYQNQGLQLGKTLNYVHPNGGTKQYGQGAAGDDSSVGVIGQLIAEHIALNNSSKWGLIYVTASNSTSTCSCSCGACTGADPSTCPCACTDANCICSSSNPTSAIPSNFVELYYNYY